MLAIMQRGSIVALYSQCRVSNSFTRHFHSDLTAGTPIVPVMVHTNVHRPRLMVM